MADAYEAADSNNDGRTTRSEARAHKRNRDEDNSAETSGADSKKIRVKDTESEKQDDKQEEPATASCDGAATAAVESPPKEPVGLAAVNSHHPPPQPFLKLPSLAAIGRATASKTYKDGDIVHTNLSYEDEAANTDPSLLENVGKGLGLYLLVLIFAIIIPNYLLSYTPGANTKPSLTDACAGNELLFVMTDEKSYFCADPTTESIVLTQENKFYLQGTGQENKEARDFVLGRIETFVKKGENYVKTSEGTTNVLFTPFVFLFNQFFLTPREAEPHVYESVLLAK